VSRSSPTRPSRAYLRVRLTLRHDARIKHLGRSSLVAQATGASLVKALAWRLVEYWLFTLRGEAKSMSRPNRARTLEV
jgi:hypothetical protein